MTEQTELIELDKENEDMDGVQFVLRAMYDKPTSTPDGQCFHFCVKIEDGVMVGTDGRRIHKFEFNGLYRPGIYRVLKRLKTHVVMALEKESDYKKPFPPYKELFDYPAPDHTFSKLFPSCDNAIAEGLTTIIRNMQSWETIQPGYLMDLDDIFDCSISKNSEYIYFTNQDKTAVVLKMKFEV